MTRGSAKLLVISQVGFHLNYGTMGHLLVALNNAGVEVEMYAPMGPEELGKYSGLPVKVHALPDFISSPYKFSRKIKWVHSFLMATVKILGRGWRYPFMTCESMFFPLGLLLKKLNPNRPFIHYAPELNLRAQTSKVKSFQFWDRVYERYADVPDLTIDVEPHRAAARKESLGLSEAPLVLPNTVPREEFMSFRQKACLVELAGGGIPPGVPILLYAGNALPHSGLSIIVKGLSLVKQPYFFLAFCYGDPERDIKPIRSLAMSILGPERSRICDPVPRIELLQCMSDASAGFAFYPYSTDPCLNQKFPAPSKLYECLAAGIAVIGSANDNLRAIIEGNGLGVCAADDSPEALCEATERLLKNPRIGEIGRHGRSLFVDELCFERASPPVLHAILQRLVVY